MTNEKYRTVVKHRHVRHAEMTVLAGLVIIGLVFVLWYFVGGRGDIASSSVDSRVSLETQERLLALQEELDVQRVQHELDGVSLEMVRKEMALKKDQVAELEEGIKFYKGLMAPEEVGQGLSLRKVEVLVTEKSDRFVFRIIAQQAAVKHTTLKGSLTIEIFGRLGEESISYPLADLSEDIENNKLTLRFRYFQSIQGEVVLPAGFDPEGFAVIAKASSPRKVELREQFPWDVQEKFTYVGK
jgi:hypothetical protein